MTEYFTCWTNGSTIENTGFFQKYFIMGSDGSFPSPAGTYTSTGSGAWNSGGVWVSGTGTISTNATTFSFMNETEALKRENKELKEKIEKLEKLVEELTKEKEESIPSPIKIEIVEKEEK